MERRVRLATGLTLFAYAASHFLVHATGLFRLDVMDQARNIVLWPWQIYPGRVALFGSLFVHGSLGLRALYRRRHLRIPPGEAWQLALGLSIPLLMIPHATNVRIGAAVYGLDDSYYRILYQYFVTPPITGLIRQMALLFAVWVHGCVGIHFWLRARAWYPGWRMWLLGGAVLLPFAAILGLVNAGWDAAMTASLHPDFAAAHGPPVAATPRATDLAAVKWLWLRLQLLYVALVAIILVLRLIRNLGARRRRAIKITYPDGRAVTVPRGFSVLEASRWGRVPHASICGGRGRCSTCRVRITRGLDDLPAPLAIELETLARVAAPPGVRLACQLRPKGDVFVQPLLATDTQRGMRVAGNEARELHVTALFVDLRDSTALAAGRMPFDALFLIDRYVGRVTAAVEAAGGHITSVAGDGIMSVFGADGASDAGAAAALRATCAIWDSLDRLSNELVGEIVRPLAFGIGVHSGHAAVGSITVSGRPQLQFLGDTGNVAAKLEAATKAYDCTLIVSAATLDAAGRPVFQYGQRADIAIAGRAPCPALVLRSLAGTWELSQPCTEEAPIAEPA